MSNSKKNSASWSKPPDTGSERRRVVLLVDDRMSAHRVLVPLLEQEGFDVVSAFSVSDGLDELSTRAIDAVIADLHLENGPDGDTLLAVAARWHQGVRRFLLTADPNGPALARAVGAVWLDRAGDASGVIVEALRAALGRHRG